jgi:serine/threonine-protein kinase
MLEGSLNASEPAPPSDQDQDEDAEVAPQVHAWGLRGQARCAPKPPAGPEGDDVGPPAGPPAAAPARGRGLWLLLPLLAVAVAMGLRARSGEQRSPPGAAAPPAPSAPAPAPTAATLTAAAPPQPALPPPSAIAPVPSASSPPAASAAVATNEGVTACAVRHFAPDAFPANDVPDLGWICRETDPRRGAAGLKQRVVAAGARAGAGTVTNAMRDWAALHWYEMASFAVIRARCCPDAGPLGLPPPVGVCAPLDRSLDEIGAAAVGRGDLEAALARHRSAIHCALGSGAAADYSYKSAPTGGAEPALRRTIERGR